MLYSEFKSYLITHLWKNGDQSVIDALDLIIKTAEDELNRDFKMEDRVVMAKLTTENTTIPLPADYRELRHLLPMVGNNSYEYVIPAEYAESRNRGTTKSNQFTVVNNTIVLVEGGAVGKPLEVQCWYYRNVPRFKDLVPPATSWMAEDYFDVYLYTVLKHTAPFLREDERLATWASLGGDAMLSAQNENLDRKFAGSPLKMKFSGMRIK